MIKVGKRTRGFLWTLTEEVDEEDLRRLVFQMRDEVAGLDGGFPLVIDARKFRGFTPVAQAEFEMLLEELEEAGLGRISVLAVSTGFAGLFCTIMVRTERMPDYQFLDLAYEENWREELENWQAEPETEEME